MEKRKNPCCIAAVLLLVVGYVSGVLDSWEEAGYVSGVGDPGMKRDGLRLAIESWNQCNEVGDETPNMGSPRAADCFDVYKSAQLLNSEPHHPCILLDFSFYAHSLCFSFLEVFWFILWYFFVKFSSE